MVSMPEHASHVYHGGESETVRFITRLVSLSKLTLNTA